MYEILIDCMVLKEKKKTPSFLHVKGPQFENNKIVS